MQRIGLAAVATLWPLLVSAAEMTPFVIPTHPNPESQIALKTESVPVDAQRLVVRDDHFALGDQRVRIWGVNLSFAACFPEKEDAPLIARRLADAGVNNVRFHHMDSTNWPRGLFDQKNPAQFAPEALERLDNFIDQLARHGIRANINLHVGRAASRVLGLPESNTRYDKIVGIFTPELIEAQEQFARDILGRMNTVRKVRYADDPAIAFVEITNEDSLFMWSAARDLPELPEYYASVLRGQFNDWLKNRHKTTGALRAAWSEGAVPLGENMLADPSFTMVKPKSSATPHWQLEQHAGCRVKAVALEDVAGVRLTIEKADDTSWHLMLKQAPIQLTGGQYYTLMFRARADKPRLAAYSVGQDHDPWGNLGLAGRADLTDQWQSFRAGFVARTDEAHTRLAFSFGDDPTSFELADVRLSPGGREGLAADESLERGNAALFAPSESEPRVQDRWRFLAEAEKSYFDRMRRVIRDELGCKALVTGTVVYGPCGQYAQSDMDFIDAHSYWQHPRFPGRPWDQDNWIVNQLALVDHPDQATLPRLAAERLAGKPFTVSEYNHPAPNDYQAECIPMLAAYAAAQDWDGIWLYTYSHESDVHREKLNSYFDIDQNPAKWGFMRAGADIFLRGAVPPLPHTRQIAIARSAGSLLDDLIALHREHNRDMLAVAAACDTLAWQDLLTHRLAVAHAGGTATPAHPVAQPPTLRWDTAEGQGVFTAEAAGARVLVGHGGAQGAGISLTAPKFAAITMTTLDGRQLDASKSLLITACGRAENTGMIFSEDRATVGRNWGEPPVCIEPVTATVRLPNGHWRCQALKPDGTPAQEVPIRISADAPPRLNLAPEYATMWYLLERD